MLTYQNITKKQAIADARMHIARDHLAHGYFYKNGGNWTGCSIGCDVKTEQHPHKAWAELFGTPEEIPQLIEFLFESLPEDEAKTWHLRVREAIPEHVDVSKVGPLHASRCLTRCIGYIGDGEEDWRIQRRDVVTKAAQITATGRYLTDDEAAKASWASEAAKAASEAAGAAWAAEAASEAAAWAAGAAEIKQQADDLIELLEAAT